MAEATLIIEHAWTMTSGKLAAVRVVPHDDEGNKPRGKAGRGFAIVGKEGETHADVLRHVAGYLEQEGHDWNAFTRERMMT